MLSPETSKRRSARISLDHFRSADRLARGKAWGSVVASVASLAWLGGIGLDVREWPGRIGRAEDLATHGPLTRAHARLEAACDSCHVPFTPMDSRSWTARLVADPRASDARCTTCHPAVGGHQPSARAEDLASCASCHRDHRGRDVPLVSMPDRDCTRCHSDTDEHRKPGSPATFATSVTRFDADPSHHPEFALFRNGPARDPGRLKFNHALHMASGFNVEAGGQPLKTLADLAGADREAYRGPGQSDLDAVQLRCDSCHQGEGDRRAGPTSAGTDGAYMRPIRFERDCRACHPLDFDPELPAIRHGLQPDQVSEALWQSYAAKHVRAGTPSGETRRASRPVPGREDRAEARGEIAEEVARAGRILSGEKRCGECHTFEGADGRPVDSLSASARIARPGIPDPWLRHATFDHSRHRTARCVDCHGRAYPDSSDASRTAADVLIPTIAVCRSCHVPKAPAPNWAANGCVDCHRYHDGEGPRMPTGPVAGPAPPGSAPTPTPDAIVRWIMAGEDDGTRARRGLVSGAGGDGRP